MPQVVDLRKKSAPEKTKTKENVSNKIEWTAPEFTKYKKNKNWFILPGIIAIAIIIIAMALKNYLLVIAMVFAGFAIYVYALKEPRRIKFSVSGRGIQIDQNIYQYEDLKSFWIFYYPPEIKEISIRSKKMFVPYIKIPLGDQGPVEIRKLLLRFLPERKHVESIIDEWARRIRF